MSMKALILIYLVYTVISTLITMFFVNLVPIQLKIAKFASDKKFYNLAEYIYKRVHKKHPNDPRAKFKLGLMYYSQSNYDEATKIFEEMLSKDANNFEAYYNLGLIGVMRNRIDFAKAYFKKAVMLKPDDVDALYQLGVLEFNTKNYITALEHFCAIKPPTTVVKYCILRCRDELSKYEISSDNESILNEYRAYIKNKAITDEFKTEIVYVRALGKAGKIDEFISECENFAARDIYTPQMYKYLGLAYLIKQKINQSMKNLSLAQQANPNDSDVYEIISRLYELREMPEKSEKFQSVADLILSKVKIKIEL